MTPIQIRPAGGRLPMARRGLRRSSGMGAGTARRVARGLGSGALGLALALAAAAPVLHPARAAAQSQANAFEAAAFVDGKAITNFDVQQRARLLRMSGVRDEIDLEIGLESMIDERLKRAAASAAGIEIDPQEVQDGLGRFAQAQGAATPAALEAKLRRAGVSLVVAREFIETELLWSALIRRDYQPTVDLGPGEVEDQIKALGLDKTVEFSLGEIAMALGANPEQVQDRARQIVAELRAGGDFQAAAKRWGQTQSAPRGGMVGWAPAAQLPPQLSQMLERMQPGEVTDPIPVPRGVVILKLVDRRETPREMTDEDRERVRVQLLEQRLSRLAEGRLQELRARAYVERR
ncbi:MAG: hypothetical protein CML46_09335 [Rhodobacteraceae bacterium]|nr:hypothetical protein [Paracoccaceae bacterium]MBR27127.1 hypothetical protein [Paracoccaceae bacterium]